MRMIGILFFLQISLWAYESGDKISDQLIDKLQLEPHKTYIIDFFASWCNSCKNELPLIEKLHRELNPKTVEIIGVDVDEDVKQGENFQEELELGFKILNDPRGKIIKAFDPIGMPVIYIVKDFKVTKMILGAKDDIDQLIETAIKEVN